MRRSVYTNVTGRSSINPGAHTATVTGSGVDRNVGDDMHRTAMVMVQTGTITDGTHTISVEDSDDNSSFDPVDAAYLQGSAPELGAADSDGVHVVGYIGPRRYLRVVSTVSGATSGGTYGAVVLLGEPRRGPVDHTTS